MSTDNKGGKKPKRTKKNVPVGVVHIQSTFNNTIVTITDLAGNTVAWSSAGVKGFKGSRKSTPFAAQLVSEDAARKAVENGMRTAGVIIKGPGAGRESALRAIQAAGLRVTSITDMTAIPHNGCRPAKRRRV
ncbi:MAG: 30S ribosomal protein S11 [Deltaproteobacteria bacterium]|nr:30S ribosomal protein S11 [Deltaproteobacteria bacterium]